MADIASKQAAILKAAQDDYEDNLSNCSGFVCSVFIDVTCSLLAGTADALVQTFEQQGAWKERNRAEAIADVGLGRFVVAALHSIDHVPPAVHGHVAIVVPGTLYHGKYPKVWCGGGDFGRSQGDRSVGEIWRPTVRDRVRYFTYQLF
jgi:hypothetical protein